MPRLCLIDKLCRVREIVTNHHHLGNQSLLVDGTLGVSTTIGTCMLRGGQHELCYHRYGGCSSSCWRTED